MVNEKQVFIINGKGSVGKDTFVKMVNDYIPSATYSSVDETKYIASLMGWDGRKDTKSRKFLSDLKQLSSEYNDKPYLDVLERINFFFNSMYEEDTLLFVHIREPKEIQRVVDFYDSRDVKINTVLIRNDKLEHVKYGNMADDNVTNGIDYDYVVDNSGSLDDLKQMAFIFLDYFNIVPENNF